MISKKVILNDILYENGIPSFNTQQSSKGTTFLPRKRITNIPLNVLKSIYDAMPKGKDHVSTFDELRASFLKYKEDIQRGYQNEGN